MGLALMCALKMDTKHIPYRLCMNNNLYAFIDLLVVRSDLASYKAECKSIDWYHVLGN